MRARRAGEIARIRSRESRESIDSISSILSLLLFFLAAAGLAHAQPSLFDQLFEYHVRVKAASGAGVLHVLYERKTDPQAPPLSCYRRWVPGAGWLGEDRFQGGHRCVAFFRDALYVFRRDNYSVYRARDWRAEAVFRSAAEAGASEWRTQAWPLPWPPEAACRVGDELWVFGVEGQEGARQLRAARLCADSPDPILFGKPLATEQAPSGLAVIPSGLTAMLFWHQPAPSARLGAGPGREGNEVWAASFDGDGWSTPRRVPVPYPNSDYAVAEHGGAVWLVCKARGKRIGPKRPLMAMTFAGGQWGQAAAIPGATDRVSWPNWTLDQTLDIEAASAEGSLFVLRACRDSVVAHRWADGAWQEPEALLRLSPWPRYVFWCVAANVAASMALLPVVAWAALRFRRKPRLRVRAFGADTHATTWARRVAAQLVDVLVVLLISSGLLIWLGLGGDGPQGAEALPTTLAACSTVFFAYFVISESLTGQSFGKLLLGIAVVGANGRKPGLLRIIVRNLLRPWTLLVPTAYLVGSLLLLVTHGSQRLGDMLARTVVVDVPPPAPRDASNE